MSEENKYAQGTLGWHNEQIFKNANCDAFSFVWIINDFFYDSHLKRPKGFKTAEAHLYAVMYILSGKTDFVFVESCQHYYENKLAGRKPLL